MNKFLIACLSGIMILGCGIISSPEASYKNITEYAYKKDWGAVYDNIDKYSKGKLDASLKMLASFASAFSGEEARKDIANVSGRDLFIRILGSEEGAKEMSFIPRPEYKILDMEMKNGKAILTVKNSDGALEKVTMVLEGGKWKLQLEGEEHGGQGSFSEKKKLTLAEKAEIAKQEKLAKEAREKEEAEKAQLRRVVTMALIAKSFVGNDPMNGRYQDYITIKIALENNNDKDIKAIKGELIFNDVFGDKIHSVGFKYDEGIKAHSKKIWEGGMDYNQFMDSHKRLRSTELNNLALVWEPQTILFEDGTKMGE